MPDPEVVNEKQGWTPTEIWTLVVTSVALCIVMLDNLVVLTALPVIRVDLGSSVEQL